MSQGVAACGLTPGYNLATLQVAKNRRLGRCGKQIARCLKHVRPRSGQSNEASRHRHAAQTSARSKFAMRLVGLRRSFVRQVRGMAEILVGTSFSGTPDRGATFFAELRLSPLRCDLRLRSTDQPINQGHLCRAQCTLVEPV